MTGARTVTSAKMSCSSLICGHNARAVYLTWSKADSVVLSKYKMAVAMLMMNNCSKWSEIDVAAGTLDSRKECVNGY